MAIQVRRGNEVDFDPNKMLPGEWAVSLDTKYVRMCFSPGVCLRMATYEGFEADMAQIQQILSEVRTAEAAIKKIQSEVNAQAEIVDENTDLCEEYARRAENAADKAEAVTDVHYATKDRAGIVAPQDIHVDEQGNMVMIAETTDSTLRNSYAGGLSILAHGKYEQDSTTGAQLFDASTMSVRNNDSLDISEDGYSITAVGGSNGTYTASYTTPLDLDVLKGKTVYFMADSVSSSQGETIGVAQVNVVAESGNAYHGLTASTLKKAISVPNDVTEIRVHVYTNNSATPLETANTVVVKGLRLSFTEDAPWEKFTGRKAAPNTDYPQEIKKSVVSEVLTHNANLIDFRDGASGAGNGGVAHTNRGDGSYTRVGTATNQWGNQWFKGRYNVIPDDTNVLIHLLPGESYFVGGCALYSADENGAIAVFDLAYDAAFSVNPSKYPNGVKITGIRCQQMVTGTTYNDVIYPRIFHGREDLGLMVYDESIATLSEPNELGGLNGVEDVLDAKEIKRRFAEQRVESSKVTGYWNTNDTHAQVNFFPTKSAKVSANILCTHFSYDSSVTSSASTIEGVTVASNTTIIFRVSLAKFPTLDDFKAYLDANEVYVVYELAEPTTEALPTADQIALHSLKSFDGATYLETDSEVKPTIHSKYGTSKVGAMALELQNENANLKLQMNNTKSTEITETKVSFPAKMGTDTASGIWNVELQRPTDADYTLLGWTIINPKANVANVYVTTVDGYTLSGDTVESGAHAAFSVTIRAMWAKS